MAKKNAILTSIGLSAPNARVLLQESLPDSGRAVIVPTAARNRSTKNVIKALRQFEVLGFRTEFWDFAESPRPNAAPDVLYVAGGDPFLLMHSITSGVQGSLVDILKNGTLYFGVSAGAAVLGKSLTQLTTVLGLENSSCLPTEALGLLDEDILPHYVANLHETAVADYEQSVARSVLRLDDQSAKVLELDLGPLQN